MKNYFTDEQVEKLAWDSCFDACRVLGSEITYEFNESELKALMNLAVEAAIGQKLGFRVEHFDGGYELNFNETWQKVKEQLPLYSVKELEN